MKNNFSQSLLLVALVVLVIAWFPKVNDYDTAKTQRERIEILEMAKNSSDPAVLKQAELVRRDIERDYTRSTETQTAAPKPESETSKLWSKLWAEIWSIVVTVVSIGMPLGVATAMFRKSRQH